MRGAGSAPPYTVFHEEAISLIYFFYYYEASYRSKHAGSAVTTPKDKIVT